MERPDPKQAIKRLFAGLKLFYFFVKYGINVIGLIFVIYILFLNNMALMMKLFFISSSILMLYFIRRILYIMDENLLRTY